MRTRLGILAAVTALLLAGCGQGDDSASDATPSSPAGSSAPSSSHPQAEPTPVEGWQQVAILTATAAGGRVSSRAVRLDSPPDITGFARQFTHPGLGNRMRAAVRSAELADDLTVMGAVVTIGCAAPDTLEVTSVDGRVRIAAGPIEDSPPECLAPMTSVALVAVPSSLVS
ncbi:MAG: hypothetical protein U0R80_16310 [Nocardioidaceae bacterium]